MNHIEARGVTGEELSGAWKHRRVMYLIQMKNMFEQLEAETLQFLFLAGSALALANAARK